jgi:hypothetical protein
METLAPIRMKIYPIIKDLRIFPSPWTIRGIKNPTKHRIGGPCPGR